MGSHVKTQHLSLRNWEKFQHYKQRRPPWVKFHVELLDDYELTSLPIPTQLVYDRLLLVAARLDNRIPNDPKFLASLLHLPSKTITTALRNLIDNGFLEVSCKRSASNDLAKVYARDRGREETETQELLDLGKASVENSVDRSLRSIA